MINTHTFLAKFIHWTFIPLYAYGIFKQVDNLNELEDPSEVTVERDASRTDLVTK